MADTSDASARLQGRRVSLVPLEPAHYQALRRVELSSDLAIRWRHHGRHEAPELFGEQLWANSAANFIVYSNRERDPLGITSLYNLDLATGSCYIAAARFLASPELGARIIGAVALTLDYAFDCWPLRKIHLEIPEYNYSQVASITDGLAVSEARFAEHIFLKGRYWDMHVVTIWRQTWADRGARYLRFA